MPPPPIRTSCCKAAADPHRAPREAFARDHNARAYADVRDAGRRPGGQVVYIATPHQFHAPHAILAAEHGKHIILEKPMALTLAECDAIIAAVERAQGASDRRPHPCLRSGGAADARHHRARRARPARADPQLQLHQLSLPPAPAGGARHRAGRRHPVQPGAAPDRHRAAARRRARPQRPRAARPCSIRRGRPRQAAPRCCNSTTAPRRRSSTAATIISIPTNGISASASAARRSRSRTAPPAARWRRRRTKRGRAPRPSPMARPAASCRRTSRISASPSSPAPKATCAPRPTASPIYGRDGMREIPIPRGGSMPGRREVLDDMRDRDPHRPPAGARRPLGQGHRGGRARHPAIGARGPRGRAGASGGGAGRIVTALRRRCEIASSPRGSRSASVPAPRPRRSIAASRR